MSALERYVKDAARVAGVKKVRALIDTLGIEYIYYQFVSVTGRIMGKGAPADHWERLANKGFQLVYGSTANLFISRSGRYLGYGPEASELVGLAEGNRPAASRSASTRIRPTSSGRPCPIG